MKKLILLLLIAASPLLTNTVFAYDFSSVCSTGQTLYYNITSNVEPYTVEVTSEWDGGYTNNPEGDLEIPETVEYNGVTYSVTSIGDYAFNDCNGLTSITIHEHVTNISYDAFIGCSGITTLNFNAIDCYLPEFSDSPALTTINVGENVTKIYFSHSGVTTINFNATNCIEGNLSYCTALSTLNIGDNVTNIPGSLFSGCTGIETITIPYSVTSIGSQAFYNSGLTSIEIPNSSIGEQAFAFCEELTSVTIGNSVANIGVNAFQNCKKIENIVVNSGNTIYDSRENCNAIIETETNTLILGCKNTIIPNSAEIISDNAFYGCRDLTSITIPDYVTMIGHQAFCLCSGLTSITIGNSVTSIGNWAFMGCNELETIVVNSGNTIYDSRENCNAIIETETNTLIRGCKNTIIPNSVIIIGDEAFSNCGMTGTLTIPNSVTDIGKSAFSGCSGLTGSLIIPNGVIRIDDYAFYGCSGLSSLTIGNSVEIIDSSAFSGCSNLSEVTIGNSVTNIREKAFFECSSLSSVYYTGNIEQWCGITFDEHEWFTNPLSYAHNLYIDNNLVTDLVIPNTVTEIKSYAFYGASCLTSVAIPESVTSIGNSAFEYCSSLTGSLAISSSVMSTGKYAFAYCSGFSSVIISAANIGEGAFFSCEGLTSVTIGNSVTRIGHAAFSACENITDIYILANMPPVLDYSDAFSPTTYSSATLWAPCGESDTYGAATNWSSFTNISEHFQYALNVSSNNEQYGIVTIIQQPNCTDDIAVIEATPNQDYNFVSWNDGNTDNPRNINVTGDTTFVANFRSLLATHTITAAAGENGTITPSGDVQVDDGDDAAFTITPNDGYRIASVMVDETENVTNQLVNGVYTFENVTENHTIAATFEAIPIASFTTNPEASGNTLYIAPGDQVEYTNTSLNAHHIHWYFEGADTVESAQDHVPAVGYRDEGTFHTTLVAYNEDETLTDTATLTVVVSTVSYFTISVTSNNDAYGTVSGGGTFEYGTADTISATPYEGYRFVSWNDGIVDNPRTIVVTSDSTIVANFEPDFIFSTITESFEPYELGSYMSEVAAPRWELWTDGVLGGLVSDEQAHYGSQSMKVYKDGSTDTDVVLNVNDLTTGRYKVEFYMYVPAGNTGYYNILQDNDGSDSKWGIQLTFNDSIVTIDANGKQDATNTYIPESWIKIQQYIDLDNDWSELYLNDALVVAYQWSKGQNGNGTTCKFDAIDFYSQTSNNQAGLFYIDDITINQVSASEAPTGLTATVQNELDVLLSWTAVDNDNLVFYSVSLNGEEIATTTETTYIEEHLYPDVYNYQVRAYYGQEIGYSAAANAQATIEGGYERESILVELFAYKSCGYSPYAAKALDDMEASDSLDIIVLDHHITDTYGNTQSNTRFSYWANRDNMYGQNYGFDGTPSVVFDGYLGMAGGIINVDEMQEAYIGYYNNVKEINSIYSLTAEFEQTAFNSRTFSLNVTAEKHSEYFGDDQIVVMAALAEDIDYDWSVAGKINNLVRVLYPDTNGAEATFDENNRFSTNITIDVSDEYDMSKCKVVVWIENHTQGRVMQSKQFLLRDYNETENTYTITVLANNDNYGYVTGSGTYEEGTEITLTAIPYLGYSFVSWSDGSTNNPRSIVVTSDSTFVANFDTETVFWSCDFEGEEIWTFGNEQYGNVQWQIVTPETYPEMLVTDDGAYLKPFIYQGDTLCETPGHWAMVELISQLTDFGGPGQVDEGPYIQFDNIDLYGVEHPQLYFNQIHRHLNAETVVRISIDGGATWFDHVVNADVENQEYGDTYIRKRLSIIEAAHNTASIRFQMNGTGEQTQGYGWEIDDIKIVESPVCDLILQDARISMFGYIDYRDENALLESNETRETAYQKYDPYAQSPRRQWFESNGFAAFNVEVFSNGYEDVTPMARIKVKNPSGEEIYNKVVAGIRPLSVNESDTIDFGYVEYDLSSIFYFDGINSYEDIPIGRYTVDFYVFAEGFEDADTTDNHITQYFEITDNTYSTSYDEPTSYLNYNNRYSSSSSGDEYGTVFTYNYNPGRRLSIDAYIDGNTTVGTKVMARIYEINDNIVNLFSQSELLTITDDMLGSWVNFPFEDDFNITPQGSSYTFLVTIFGSWDNEDDILAIGTSDVLTSKGFNSYLHFAAGSDDEWYYGMPQLAIRVIENMELNEYNIEVLSNNDSYGMVSGGGTYEEGASVVISATPNQGYRFVSWNDDNTDNPRRIMVTSDSTFVAMFEVEQVQQFSITVLSNNDAYGSVSGGGTYNDGDTIMLMAMPNGGYLFDSWEDDNSDNPRTITVTSDSTFIADFVKCEITQAIDTVVPNFVTVGEHTFYSTGRYSFEIQQEADCDTIYDINLTVLAEPEPFDIEPNPAKSIVNIHSDGFISFVEFYSPTGQLVMRKEVNGNFAECDVEAFAPGVYIVRIYGDESNLPSVYKIVKE